MMPKYTDQMRILVTGGRDFDGRAAVFAALDKLIAAHIWLTEEEDVVIIHGACCVKGQPLVLRGADRWADEYAKEREYAHIAVPAEWGKLGNAAGPARNRKMLEKFQPTNVVAFPGGSGTANMIDQAKRAGLVVYEPMLVVPRRTLRGLKWNDDP